MIRETSGSDILSDDLNWLGALLISIGIPRPPSLTGRAISSRSALLNTCLSVIASRKWCLIAS